MSWTRRLSHARVSSLPVKLCGGSDPTCAQPLASAVTDGSGQATLMASTGTGGFSGFWTAAAPGELENLNFFPVPILSDVVENRFYWKNAVLGVLLSSSSVSWDKSRGVVGVQAHNCNSSYLHQDNPPPKGTVHAAGVSFSISPSDPSIKTGYILSNTLSTSATMTDASGLGGFVNVPEGWVTVTATLVATGARIGSARIYAKAGALSNGIVVPQ